MGKAAALAYSFLRMVKKAVRWLIHAWTRNRSHELSVHILACFGGAGLQHAYSMAQTMGMCTVFVHYHSGVLRAYGFDAVEAVEERQSLGTNVWDNNNKACFAPLFVKANQELTDQGYPEDNVQGQPHHGAGEQRRWHLPAEIQGMLPRQVWLCSVELGRDR